MIDSIDFEALRGIGLSQALVARLFSLSASEPGDRLMRITEVQRDRVTLHDGHTALPAQTWPTLRLALQMQADTLVVGDWVLARETQPGEWWAAARVPPETRLLRRDSRGERQPLVSNVDTALLVMGMGHDFNLRRLDRYLALVRLAGVRPVVVLSKADLHAEPAARVLAVRRHLGLEQGGRLHGEVDVLALDGRAETARAALAPWLGVGQTLVLMGSSGAGKSTLTNTLAQADGGSLGSLQSTGPVRQGDDRGRHTTTARSLHRCPAGACIIDTPGLRGLQLDADEAQLDAAFDDVASLAPHCRFRDCEHHDEPGCAVRPAIAPERLLSYQKLMREARRHEMTVFDRQQQMAVWKARGRAAKAVSRSKRG
ncbi:MAG TPA: ribosome small subunit-dependent GTPase A [Ideonella sp.]|nr:ribosome small subunit-dependent GTPase A [Ideonella sp.]